MASPSPLAPTGTNFDAWLGGLPHTGMTVVVGGAGTGKTTMLWCWMTGLGGPGTLFWISPDLPWPHIMRGLRPDMVPRIAVESCETLEGVWEFLSAQTLGPDDLVVLDDFDELHSRSDELGAAAVARVNICKLLSQRETPCVASAEKMAGLGRGFEFNAGRILGLQQVARTGAPHEGVVVQARVEKSRWSPPGEIRSLWLRPGGSRPLSFA